MKIKKQNLMAAGILALFFIAFNTAVFAVCGFSDHGAAFWTSWCFMTFAFIALAATALILGKQTRKLRDWIFGYPLLLHGGVYLAVELVASIVFIILDVETVDVPFVIVFLSQFLVACAYIAIALSCFIAKTTIEEVRADVKKNTSTIKTLRVKTESLVEKCDDADTRAVFKAFAEKVRCSDPVSSEALAETEEKLCAQIGQCDEALDAKDYARAAELCREAEKTLSERNRLCKMLK